MTNQAGSSSNAATTEARPVGRRYIAALDGLRWVAFLMVFIHHSYLTAATKWTTESPSFLSKLCFSIVHTGAYGVPIFFALSGFLITSLLVAEKGQSGTISLRDFYIRRSLRIWPLYYLGPVNTI